MIPKIIHYCWFGGNPKPAIVETCIASWRKYCPEWEILEWNESNYDVSVHPYTKEAYEAKKWAFVSDVARLEAIIQYGGVYLDTDVEILEMNPFAAYLQFDAFLAFETERSIASGLCLGGEKGSLLCRKLLSPYLKTHYTRKTESVNSMVNKPVFQKEFPLLKWDGKTQEHDHTCFIGLEEYGRLMKHYGTRSWCDNLPQYKISRFWRLKKLLRNPEWIASLEKNRFLKKLVPIYIFMVYDFLDLGPLYYIKRMALKLKNNETH